MHSPNLRPIKPIPLVGIKPKTVSLVLPEFAWADPQQLYVEIDYQRSITKNSIKLIREIAVDFDWLHIKPIVCARTKDSKMLVIDGQHTAIAAVSIGVKKVPIMVVDAPEMKIRARAFVAQNVCRLTMSRLQIFHAKVTGEDPKALAAAKVAKAAKVRIVHSQPGSGDWEIGDTMAAAAIERMVCRLGEERATNVLKTLVSAKRAPVAVHEILAVSAVLYDAKYGWHKSAFDLVTVIRSRSIEEWRGMVLAGIGKDNRTAIWKGIAEAWVKAAKRRCE
jgi:hypothetical protein